MSESTEEGRRPPAVRNPWVWAFFIGIASITLIRPFLRHIPDPPPVLAELPRYRLVASSGASFGTDELAGQVYIANFFFSRCTSICLPLTRSMAALGERLDRWEIEDVRLVSISVDPEYDSPETLQAYAELHGVDPRRWTLLTGESAEIARLVRGGFLLDIGETETDGAGWIDIAHSGKLVLVDGQGRIRGYYDTDEPGLDEVFHRAIRVREEQRSAEGSVQLE